MTPVLAKFGKGDRAWQEFGIVNPNPNTQFLIVVVGVKLLARYFCQFALFRCPPQSIDRQRFTLQNPDNSDSVQQLASWRKLQYYHQVLGMLLSLPFLSSIVFGSRSRKKAEAQVGRTEIRKVLVGLLIFIFIPSQSLP